MYILVATVRVFAFGCVCVHRASVCYVLCLRCLCLIACAFDCRRPFAFEEVLLEAGNQKQTRTGAIMLMLAGEDRSQMHHDVATAVAGVARETSWDDIRPHIISAVLRIGTLALIYSASVWILVHY